jgi:hypothetical protein
MRYGGRRYYFLCPKHGRRFEVLPMVGGVFASRQAGRLTYQSQSADQIDRMRDRAHKLEKRLWPDKGKPRPRGRNRERMAEAWSEADSALKTCSPRRSCAAGAIYFRAETNFPMCWGTSTNLAFLP